MPFAELYKNIFEKDGPNEQSPELLQELVKEYPYFSLAHFYLLQQTPETSDRYPAVAARTALHFNNPYFLQAQLKSATQRTGKVEILDETEAATPSIAPEIKEDVAAAETDQPGADVLAENQPPAEDIVPVTGENEVAEKPAVENAVENQVAVDTEPAAKAETGEPFTANQNNLPRQEADLPVLEETIAPDNTTETPIDSAEEEQDVPEEIHYVPIDLPEDKMQEVKPAVELAEASGEQQEVPTNNQGEEVANTAAPSSNNGLAESSPKPTDNAMIFEPLHATDYFASQGIKLREETQPGDKLGKQLKSFTEWLKTMKKVHDTGADSNAVNIDLSVQTLAEKSNKEEEILTEAMADVFIQQGKASKAREIYQKLSLLNPAKSAYFAAKIDQIK